MLRLPMLTCINPFEVEFKRDRESAYIELQNTIPTHQFSIDDAGIRTTLNWIPEVNGLTWSNLWRPFEMDKNSISINGMD